MQKVYDFLKKCGTYYLATCDGDQPRVRPFGTVDIFEGRLYFQTGKVKDVAKQLEKNAKIEISGMADGKWIRLSGEAVADDRYEPKAHMLDAYPELKGMYSADDGNTIVYYLKNVKAVICSFTEAPEVIKF